MQQISQDLGNTQICSCSVFKICENCILIKSTNIIQAIKENDLNEIKNNYTYTIPNNYHKIICDNTDDIDNLAKNYFYYLITWTNEPEKFYYLKKCEKLGLDINNIITSYEYPDFDDNHDLCRFKVKTFRFMDKVIELENRINELEEENLKLKLTPGELYEEVKEHFNNLKH